MKKLAKREEQIMHVLWEIGPAFVKDIIAQWPEPKPHYNSISTIVKILEKKGFIGHEAFGKSHQYYPILTKDEYKKKSVDDLLGNFFNNSPTEMLTYFAKKEKINEDELNEIIKMIKNKE